MRCTKTDAKHHPQIRVYKLMNLYSSIIANVMGEAIGWDVRYASDARLSLHIGPKRYYYKSAWVGTATAIL